MAVSCATLLQNKASTEKAKQALDSEYSELQIEMETLRQSKVDSEHRRKKAEAQVRGLECKYTDSEQQQQETDEKMAKLQVQYREMTGWRTEEDFVADCKSCVSVWCPGGAGNCECPAE